MSLRDSSEKEGSPSSSWVSAVATNCWVSDGRVFWASSSSVVGSALCLFQRDTGSLPPYDGAVFQRGVP